MTDMIDARLLLDRSVITEPNAFYDRLRTEAPVWRVPGTELFVVSSHALVAEATSRVEDLSSNMHALLYRGEDGLPMRLSFGDAGVQTLATADPPMHALHRSTVFPELVAKRMAALEDVITEAAAECVDRAMKSPSSDFMASVANVIPFTVISQLIGFRGGDPDQLRLAAFESTELLGSTISLERLHSLIGAIGDIEAWIVEQLVAAADDPGVDILGSVARGVADGAFGIHEGAVILHTLLSAGGESTTSLLGNAVRMLAEHPEVQDQLRDDPTLIPAFVEEVLRLESPFRYLMRSVHEPTSLGGVDLPAGATILLLWGAANRDPAQYEAADEIDLTRQPLRSHMAFGRGIHHCVGAPLARLEGRIVLEVLLDRTRSVTLDPDHAPQWANSLLVRRHDLLPVVLDPR